MITREQYKDIDLTGSSVKGRYGECVVFADYILTVNIK